MLGCFNPIWICWVVLPQFWVKYGPTQLLYFLGCFNPILDQILTNLIVGFAGLFKPNFGSNMDKPNCWICWVVLTQFWVKYGQTQLLDFLGCFNPILEQIWTNLIVGFAGLF